MVIEKFVLDNGVTLLSERLEHVKSVSIAVWTSTTPPADWTRDAGVRHFIEHLVFKGTERRSAKDIARAIEGVGGVLDAWTDHEATTFSAKILDKHLGLGVDVLSDLVTAPRFLKRDIELERKVVLDEILRETNDPGSNAFDQYVKDAWPRHPSGMLILGTDQTVRGIDREKVVEYYEKHYVGKNMIVASSGHIDTDRFIEAATAAFGQLPPGNPSDEADFGPPTYMPKRTVYNRKFDHINLCLGMKGLPYDNAYRYEFAVLDTLFGGGISSRLFQEIREKHGLCYSIGTFSIRRRDSGLFAIHSASAEASLRRLVKLIVQELRTLAQDGVTDEEIIQTKEQLKGGLMLALESTYARVMRLVRGQAYFGKVFSLDEICAGVDAVTKDSVNELVRLLFSDGELGITIVGNLDGSVLDKIDLSLS
ncbi:MAG TPA: pitrilysin family protein [bacterium]|nr:pitrilysin family protein [bacterium]